MYYLISKSALTKVMLTCVKSMFFYAVRFTRIPKSALRSCIIQYYLTATVMLKKAVSQWHWLWNLWATKVWSNTTHNQHGTPISESEFWCNVPKSYITIIVFTFDVGYWSRHWTITWKATTVSKTLSENTTHWNASHWVPLHKMCDVVNGNVRSNDC
jgi:hypothetical protein